VEKQEVMIGIYTITNLRNSKVYVGSSVTIEKRLKTHLRELANGFHVNTHLQAAYDLDKKYFKFEVLESCTKDSLILV